MKIELKNLKVSASLSEETTAYTATIYVDGKPAFHASNHGTGGCDLYHPVKGYAGPSEREINDWLKANHPKIESGFADCPPLDPDLELIVGELIANAERQRILNRMLKNKIVLLGESNGQPALFTINRKPEPAMLDQWRAMKAKGAAQGKELVNGNPALIERALALV